MIFIVDISMLIHKLYHQSEEQDHVPSWALHKLERIRLHFLNQFPEIRAFVCAFDNPTRQLWRQAVMYQHTGEIYKDGRTKKPELPEIEAGVLEAVQLDADWQAIVAPQQFEADDVIASVCRAYQGKVLIHSQDRDYQSLLEQGRVGIVKKSNAPEAGAELEVEIMSAADLYEKEGVMPSQWVDYMCLLGGKDNVPGWDGVGEKKAKEIIQSGCPLEEVEGIKLNKTQTENYPKFKRLLPLIRIVRAPVSYLDVGEIELTPVAVN